MIDWEARLAAEGLAPLDCGDRLSNRGIGRRDQETVERRLAGSVPEEPQRRLPRLARAVMRLRAAGHGRKDIARRLETTEYAVTEAERSAGGTGRGCSWRSQLPLCDTATLMLLAFAQ